MNRFSYLRAESVESALAALAADPAAKLIAGGTNLLDLMKYDVEQPSSLIDITHIDGVDTIGETATGGVMIGALVSNTTIAYHPLIAACFPLLSSAILAGATPQLRNAATVGGNLNQRTRCYYFYDAALPCNKREAGSGCPARDGVNRNHAILGASEQCIATHPSDMCVALAALGASVHVAGPQGQRMIAMADYHRLPNGSPERDTTLGPDEMVTGIELPAEAKRFGEHYSYLKLRDRQSYAFALVSVAVGLQMDGKVIGDTRLALGGVAHKPWRRTQAEEVLIGRPADEETFATAADVLLEGAHGWEHNLFKVELAHRAVVRALTQAAAGTPQSQSDKRIA